MGPRELADMPADGIAALLPSIGDRFYGTGAAF